jgi:hypothetical protein
MGVLEPLARLLADEFVDAVFSAAGRALKCEENHTAMRHPPHIVHHIPGRTRLRIPSRRDDRAFFAEVEDRLQVLPQVIEVSTNATTASVLIRYRGEIEPVLLEATKAGRGDLLELHEGLPPIELVADVLLDRPGRADRWIRAEIGRHLEQRSAALIVLLVSGLIRLIRGRRHTVPASSMGRCTEL